MKNDLSEEKFDQLLKKLMADAALDEGSVNEIADSPTLWWGVQRRINEQRSAGSPWPPVKTWMRWVAIGVPVVAVLAVVVGLFVYRPAVNETPVAVTVPANDAAPNTAISRPLPITNPMQIATTDEQPKPRTVKTKLVETRKRVPTSLTAVVSRQPQEVKTNFIALSYASDPESGQVVRVKVPSSMMVSTGLVASVRKPSELVDAEIIVGDDGLTRAIRFIHKQ
jgi:hypothetical protein